MPLMDAFGKMISDGGRGRVRSAANTRRLIRCRVTARRAVFFDTITAYPFDSFGETMLRFGDENLRPVESAVGKAARESRSRRGNTGTKQRGACAQYDGVSAQFYGQSSFLIA